MAREQPQVNLRLPAELKARLEEAAAANGRSLTAEMVYRLQAAEHPLVNLDAVAELVKALGAGTHTMTELLRKLSDAQDRSAQTADLVQELLRLLEADDSPDRKARLQEAKKRASELAAKAPRRKKA
jgi:uncharacterized protein (DUF1778 family)